MITITRIGGNPLGVSQYELVLNGTTISSSFDHNRSDDLPKLLHKAADQVIIERAKFGDAVYNTKRPSKEDTLPTVSDVVKELQYTINNLTTWNEQTENVDEKVTLSTVLEDLEQIVLKYESA